MSGFVIFGPSIKGNNFVKSDSLYAYQLHSQQLTTF